MIQRLLGSPRATRFFFDHIGPSYRWMTNNPLWRESLREMARHLPPSGSTLTVLDAGCGPGNSAQQLLEFRPDLRILGLDFSIGMLRFARNASDSVRFGCLQSDVTRLPLPDNSIDAVTAHSVYYMLHRREVFLAEALRVLRPGGRLIMLNPIERRYPVGLLAKAWRSRAVISLLTWHAVSRMHRRFTIEELAHTLTGAGFTRVLSERAVEGFGVLSRGEKPYLPLSTVERIAQTAEREKAATAFQIVEAAQLGEASRGRFIFLLVKQTPNKPSWAAKPGELRWQAAMVNDLVGQPYLLVFTSLTRAVEFMQSAVLAHALIGINKVAKYDKQIAPQWSADFVLNPTFEMLRASEKFTFNGITLDVDPAQAVTGEE